MNPAAVDVAFNERLRRHEAAHAAAALAVGLDVHQVRVGTHNVTDLTWDSEGTAGCTQIDAPNTPDGHRLMAISIMAGPLEDRQAGWPRPWPLPRVDLTPGTPAPTRSPRSIASSGPRQRPTPQR